MLSNDKVQTRFHQVEKNHCVWGSELGPVLCRKKGRYVELIRLHIPVNCMELHWRQPCSDPVAPYVIKKGRGQKKEKERKFVSIHLFRCYTHTHPAGAGSTLKGKRKKKADTNDGPTTKTAQAPEPTYTAKRTWPKQSTHLNPTTHYGEARREN